MGADFSRCIRDMIEYHSSAVNRREDTDFSLTFICDRRGKKPYGRKVVNLLPASVVKFQRSPKVDSLKRSDFSFFVIVKSVSRCHLFLVIYDKSK